MIEIRTGSGFARSFFATASQSLVVATLATGCATIPQPASSSHSRFLMGTRCDVTLAGDASDAAAAFDEIDRIERFLSTWKDDSELSRLNQASVGEEVALSPELAHLLAESLRVARQSGGAFNPLIRPLLDAWRTREEGSFPDASALAAARARTDLSLVSIDEKQSRATRRGDARFEEGGFGKGYALDRAVAVLGARGVPSAVLNFGGQIVAFGAAVDADIADPGRRDTPAITVSIRDASLSTSAGSEKHFEIGGIRFSHIIDPRSGDALPPRGSVSVIHASAFAADALSTALYVMGPDAGLQFANDQRLRAIFIVPSGSSEEHFEVHVSDSLSAEQQVRSIDPTKFNVRKNS